MTSMAYNSLIFDLGDVLFTWSDSPKGARLPAVVLRRILQSAHWFEYEKGNLSEEEIYTIVAHDYDLPIEDVQSTIQGARDTLQRTVGMLKFIQELKQTGFTIYAMSNISQPDWEILSTKARPEDWDLFDRIYTSAAMRARKPDLAFYKHVIEDSEIDPARTIFVDDKLENVLSARSFGMHGLVFDEQANVIRLLKNLCYDPVRRGKQFLESHKGNFRSMASNGVEISDNFSQFLILELTGDQSLIAHGQLSGPVNFFHGAPALTTDTFPNDLDTTSIALSICDCVNVAGKRDVMEEMLNYKNSDGIIQVYFDHSRPRIDPVVCTNVLTLFYAYGRGSELSESLDWVEQVLLNRAYITGTYYYAGGDLFLYFLSRLLNISGEVRMRFSAAFRERVTERFGEPSDSIGLACRILAALSVGIMDERDLRTLLSRQCEDGSWKDGWLYKYGSSGIRIGNDGVTTAFAIRAIQDSQFSRMTK